MAEYTNKWTTTIQFPTCLMKLIKGVVSLVRWKIKWECRYHETVTHSFSFSYDFHPSNKVSIFIAILGVSASASPSSQSGLALVLINKKNCNVESKVRASAFGFIEVHVNFMKTYRCRCEREHHQGICASNHPYVITFHNSIAQISMYLRSNTPYNSTENQLYPIVNLQLLLNKSNRVWVFWWGGKTAVPGEKPLEAQLRNKNSTYIYMKCSHH